VVGLADWILSQKTNQMPGVPSTNNIAGALTPYEKIKPKYVEKFFEPGD
jgi:hypothetical protein